MTMRNILVTGGTGFIGRHIVLALLKRGNSVIVLDNNLQNGAFGTEARFTNRLQVVCHNLANYSGLPEVVNECDYIVHLGGTSNTRAFLADFRIDLDNSLSATWNLLQAIATTGRCKRFIYASSQHVYGTIVSDEKFTVPESTPLCPISSYGASKVACEAIISAFAVRCKFSPIILRLSNIVGTGQNYGVLVDFVNKLKLNQSILKILGNGRQFRNYLHVSDLSSVILTLLTQDNPNIPSCFNVANRDFISTYELASIVVDELRLDGCDISTTSTVDTGWEGDPGSVMPNISRILELGWSPILDCKSACRRACRELWEDGRNT